MNAWGKNAASYSSSRAPPLVLYLTIWTELFLLLCGERFLPEEVVKTRSMATQGIIRGHEPGKKRTQFEWSCHCFINRV